MQKDYISFIHISDTHIHNDPNYTNYGSPLTSQAGAKALVEIINNLDFEPDFVLHTGDVAFNPYEEAYDACKAILNKIKFPTYYVTGNHDTSQALQKTFFPERELQDQLHYSVDVGGVQLVVVDSNGDEQPPRGHLTTQQKEWLTEICRSDDPRPLIIATHHNPVPVGDMPWLDGFMGIQNGDEFHQAILPAKHRLRGVFFGHVHQNLDIYQDGILYASTLSSWVQFYCEPEQSETVQDYGAEPGYSIVKITPNQTFIRRCRFNVPLD